ncbi:MAG: peptidoglycan-binding protein [Clostridiaceae bacterium]
MANEGTLTIEVYKEDTYIPIEKAKVTVTQLAGEARQKSETIFTDSSGRSKDVILDAPPIENSMNPGDKPPYSLCNVLVEAPGYENIFVKGCQIYPDNQALQPCNLKPIGNRQEELIDIVPNTLVGSFPPKIPEDPNKELPKDPSGFVVLAQPVVPQYIVVHTGVPSDNSAPNYTVRYKDYIKNVASCEIFSTWTESTIRANIYCIISFTLNRIYTEWYRGKGKNFDITNSTAYDHAFTYGRNIYTNISRIVDSIFSTYMKRPGKKQPLLSQYCDGVQVTCPGWLTQWGSKYLGDDGVSPYNILTNFYGTNLNLEKAEKVKGIPMSYPGYVLTIGATGAPVRTVQTYLNRIAVNYPAIPKTRVDGIYGEGTTESVKVFQGVFNLPKTGIVNYPTWYAISDIYVAVTGIAEIRSEFVPPIAFNMPGYFVPRVRY